VDVSGNILVADSRNHCIRAISPEGQVTTLAGNVAGKQGPDAPFHKPSGVTVDLAGNVIVADRTYHRLRKVTPEGHVSTLAGTNVGGHRDGEGSMVRSK
jgi:hypothetical protein